MIGVATRMSSWPLLAGALMRGDVPSGHRTKWLSRRSVMRFESEGLFDQSKDVNGDARQTARVKKFRTMGADRLFEPSMGCPPPSELDKIGRAHV